MKFPHEYGGGILHLKVAIGATTSSPDVIHDYDHREGEQVKPTVGELMKLLRLRPLPEEGGFFVETFRSAESVDARQFQRGHDGKRSLSTAIYYLVTPASFSALHRVPGEEMFHFYLGDPVEMFELHPDGLTRSVVLGPDIRSGMTLQHVVPGGVWQGCRLVADGEYALLGTTMAPGFDYADFVKGNRDELTRKYPQHAKMIRELTREPI